MSTFLQKCSDTCMMKIMNYSKIASLRYTIHQVNIIKHILGKKGIDPYIFRIYIYPYIVYEIHALSPIRLIESKLSHYHICQNKITLSLCYKYTVDITINKNTHALVKVIGSKEERVSSIKCTRIDEIWQLIYHLYCELYMVSHYYDRHCNKTTFSLIQSLNTLLVV